MKMQIEWLYCYDVMVIILFYRLKKIKSNLKDAKKLSEEKLEIKERKSANAKSLPKRLGKYAYLFCCYS